MIDLMPEQRALSREGRDDAARRLSVRAAPGHQGATRAYGTAQISERHRHRYEVNPDLRDQLSRAGLVFSGISPDGRLVEVIELENHPWFVGCQYHPEFKSRPFAAHPLFDAFVQAAIAQPARAEELSLPRLGPSPKNARRWWWKRDVSSVGRAPCSHRGGHWFEPSTSHHRKPSAARSEAKPSEVHRRGRCRFLAQ